MNTNGQDPAKGRKLKTLIATIIAAVIILFAGIWAISAALNSGKKSENGAKTTEISKTTEKEKTEQTGSKPTSPSDQYTPTTQTVETTPTPAPVVTENPIPTTGPTEVIFSALMLGVVASLIVLNVQLVQKRDQE